MDTFESLIKFLSIPLQKEFRKLRNTVLFFLLYSIVFLLIGIYASTPYWKSFSLLGLMVCLVPATVLLGMRRFVVNLVAESPLVAAGQQTFGNAIQETAVWYGRFVASIFSSELFIGFVVYNLPTHKDPMLTTVMAVSGVAAITTALAYQIETVWWGRAIFGFQAFICSFAALQLFSLEYAPEGLDNVQNYGPAIKDFTIGFEKDLEEVAKGEADFGKCLKVMLTFSGLGMALFFISRQHFAELFLFLLLGLLVAWGWKTILEKGPAMLAYARLSAYVDLSAQADKPVRIGGPLYSPPPPAPSSTSQLKRISKPTMIIRSPHWGDKQIFVRTLAINKKLEVFFRPDEGKDLPPERETFYDNPTCSNGYSPHVKVEMMPTTRYPDPKYPVIEQDLRKEHRRHHIVYREAGEGPFQFVKATGLNLEFKGLDQFAFRKGGGFKVSGYPLRLTMECD